MQKILVVDDAALNRELLHDVLRDDYLVEMAEDGEEAMRKLEADGKGTAALLLDLNMPRMSGFDVLAEMSRRQWLQHIPVLIISGEYSPEIENRCFEMGVSDFIHKPFESSIVKNRVRNTITLFGYQKRLEQTVEEQAQTLKKQKQIIQIQAVRPHRHQRIAVKTDGSDLPFHHKQLFQTLMFYIDLIDFPIHITAKQPAVLLKLQCGKTAPVLLRKAKIHHLHAPFW